MVRGPHSASDAVDAVKESSKAQDLTGYKPVREIVADLKSRGAAKEVANEAVGGPGEREDAFGE